jgi:hypothetical protein
VKFYKYVYRERPLCRLIRRPEHLITGIFWQTEGHSFGDYLISESVSVTPSSDKEAFIVLFCVFMTRVSQCSISLRPELIYIDTEFPEARFRTTIFTDLNDYRKQNPLGTN